MATTLYDLRERCKARFDANTSSYISDSEWNVLINEAAEQLHNWIVLSGEDYLVKRHTIALESDVSEYPLPPDMFKALKVYGKSTTGGTTSYQYWQLRRMMPGEFRPGIPDNSWALASSPFGYMISGQKFLITPNVGTDSNASIELWYTPLYTTLNNDADVVTPSVPGADEFVVNQVVINARIKEESDVGPLLVVQNELKLRMQEALISRDLGAARTIVDVRRGDSFWGSFAAGY